LQSARFFAESPYANRLPKTGEPTRDIGGSSSYIGGKRRPGMSVETKIPSGTDLRAEIDRLRKERNAVILAHYYQKPELQDLADFVGDSLELSRKAAETDAEVIAFCGVKFMADTAKILSPEKIVVLPDMEAGCSLEDSCPPDKFKAFRDAHPDHIALTYINCSTEVKALSDVIVTASSAARCCSGPACASSTRRSARRS
jgi:quinolinate synthase